MRRTLIGWPLRLLSCFLTGPGLCFPRLAAHLGPGPCSAGFSRASFLGLPASVCLRGRWRILPLAGSSRACAGLSRVMRPRFPLVARALPMGLVGAVGFLGRAPCLGPASSRSPKPRFIGFFFFKLSLALGAPDSPWA